MTIPIDNKIVVGNLYKVPETWFAKTPDGFDTIPKHGLVLLLEVGDVENNISKTLKVLFEDKILSWPKVTTESINKLIPIENE